MEDLKGTDYLEGLGVDGSWDSGRDLPGIHYFYQNSLFLLYATFCAM
jgi:hypothetical protein